MHGVPGCMQHQSNPVQNCECISQSFPVVDNIQYDVNDYDVIKVQHLFQIFSAIDKQVL